MPIFPPVRTVPTAFLDIPDMVLPSDPTVVVSVGPVLSGVVLSVSPHSVDQNGSAFMGGASKATDSVNQADTSENQAISQLRLKNPITGV